MSSQNETEIPLEPVVPVETIPTTSVETIPTTTTSSLDNTVSPMVDSIISKLQSVYMGDMSALNIVSIVTTTMQIVERLPKMKGGQKKALVLSVVHKLGEKCGIDKSLLTLIPDMIDMAISIQNGVVKIVPKIPGCCC